MSSITRRSAAAAAAAAYNRLVLQQLAGAGAAGAGIFVPPGTSIATSTIQLLAVPTGAGGGAGSVFLEYLGELCRQLNAGAAGAFYSRQLANNPSGFLCIAPGNLPRFVYRLAWRMAMDVSGADNGHATGCIVKLDQTSGTGGPGASIPQNTFGIVADTLGGWSLVSRRAGAELLNIPVPIDGPVTGLHDFVIEVVPATSTVAAILNVYADDVLVHSENWASGNLPTVSDAIAAGGVLGLMFDFSAVCINAGTAANLVYGSIDVSNTPV